MGKVIKKKIQGMSWLFKTGLVLMLTTLLAVSGKYVFDAYAAGTAGKAYVVSHDVSSYQITVGTPFQIRAKVIDQTGVPITGLTNTDILTINAAKNATTNVAWVAGTQYTAGTWTEIGSGVYELPVTVNSGMAANDIAQFTMRTTTGTFIDGQRFTDSVFVKNGAGATGNVKYVLAQPSTNADATITANAVYTFNMKFIDALGATYQPTGGTWALNRWRDSAGATITGGAVSAVWNAGGYYVVSVPHVTALTTGNRQYLTVSYTVGNFAYYASMGLTAVAAQNNTPLANPMYTTPSLFAPAGNLTIGAGTNPANANASQASLNNAIDGFTLAMSTGSGAVTSLTVLGDANFTAANIPTNGVKVYRDAGVIGTYEAGTDTLVSTASSAVSGNATTVTLTSETVTTAAANYLVTVDLTAGATPLSGTLTATVSGAAGTGLGTVTDSDTTGATLTIVAGNVVTVGEGTNPANNLDAQRGSSQAIDGFTLASSTGAASVTAITVTGNANFTATNVGTNGVKIYRDLGTVGTLDGADVLLNTTSPAIAANATTVTLTVAEAVTTTPVNYLVVVNIAAAATLTNTITANVSGVTQTGAVSVTDSDAASATLTVTAAQTLTIGNGTNPANANIQTGNSASLDAFTMAINSGTGSINSLTLTGSANFTTANIASAAIYVDNGVVGTYEAGTDTLVASSYGQVGTVGTITFSAAESVTTVAKNYLVRVTANGGATVSNTFTGTITGATGVGIVTANDTASATLTIVAGPVSTINSCGGCHGNPPVDGTARNTPAGQFLGDHGKHTAAPISLTCINCHVDNGTSPTGNDHQDGQIQIASPLRAVTGESYGQATHAVSNSPVFSSCTTYCHSQGTSKTSNAGETRTATLSTPVTTATWATTTTTCASCHDNPPNYATGATTWGAAKANSHQGTTHAAQLCTRCHNSVTGPTTVTTGHADGLYTVAAANVGYTYAPAGGSCNATGTGCHNATPIQWGTTLKCIDCHASAQGTRSAVVGEFGLAWGHKKTGRGAVTDEDCIVCHLEGKYTGAVGTAVIKTAFHSGAANGNIDLRDPDGAGETAITNISGTAFTFTKFATSYAAGSRTTTGHTSNTDIANVLTQKFCLACHDSNGATNPTARSTVTSTAVRPLGGINLGANYTVLNGAAVATGDLINVKSQFTTTNSSVHPILGPLNRDFPIATRLAVPYNGQAAGRVAAGGVKSLSVVMNCFDCHNTPTTPLTTRTVSAHGNAVTLRGTLNVTTMTLCAVCHTGYTVADNHGSGSAMASATGRSAEGFNTGCYSCHGNSGDTDAGVLPTVTRPITAQNYHGFNTLVGGVAKWPAAAGGKPYAFIRNTVTYAGTAAYHRPLRGIGELTTGSATCMGGTGCAGNGSARVYTPGGQY